MLVVSGVYYPVEVLPEWMQWIAKISPATYALRGCRNSILLGAGLSWDDVWPLLVIGLFSIPIGPAGVPGRRALREATWKAEAVWMIELRVASVLDDFETWAEVKSRVVPDEPVTAEQLVATRRAGQAAAARLPRRCGRRLRDRRPVRTSASKAFIMARVLPEHRCRGVGSELVRALAEHGRALGRNGVNSFVEWHDEPSIRFAEKLGLTEVDYQLEQVRLVGAEAEPELAGGDRGRRARRPPRGAARRRRGPWRSRATRTCRCPAPSRIHVDELAARRGDAARRLVRRLRRRRARRLRGDDRARERRRDGRARADSRPPRPPAARDRARAQAARSCTGPRRPGSSSSSPGRRRATRRCRRSTRASATRRARAP